MLVADLVPDHHAFSSPLASTASRLRANQEGCQKGLTDWGYLPGQWRLANVAYPLFRRQGRVNDGGGSNGAMERPPSRIFQAPTQAPNATTGQTVLSKKHHLTCALFVGLGRFELPTFGPPDRCIPNR